MNANKCNCARACNCNTQPPATVPQAVVNASGLNALSCRVGNYNSFFESLKRRLSSSTYPQLAKLLARQTSDPSIALLDAWSIVGDVLTFYNERFINENYLRTASERRSLAELSNLIGYRPGPGVASSVYLAFTLEKDPKQASEETLIPKGTAVKSVPGDGEMPQTFETMESILGRQEWNSLKPRRLIPQVIEDGNVDNLDKLYVKGTDVVLKPNDELLLSVNTDIQPTTRVVTGVLADYEAKVTEIIFEETKFSIRSMRRDVIGPVEALLALPKPTSFVWFTGDVLPSLDKIVQGQSPATLPLNRLKRLSDYDATLSNWLESLAEAKADLAVAELAKADSPFVVAQKVLKNIKDTEFPKSLTAANKLCAELASLDKAAQDCFKAADAIKLTNTTVAKSEIQSAEASIQDLFDSPQFPTVLILTSHLDKLVELHTSIKDMATPGADLQIDDDLVDAFILVKNSFQLWWGLTNSGNLNGGDTTGASGLKKAFKDLSTALTPGDSVEIYLGKIAAQQKIVEGMPQVTNGGNPSGPEADRIGTLSDELKKLLEAYAKLIKSVAPDVIAGSKILEKLDEVILKDLRTTSDVVALQKKADGLINDGDNFKLLIESATQLAKLTTSLSLAIEGRRELFSRRAQTLFGLHKGLEASTIQAVKDLWNEAAAILVAATDTTQIDSLDPSKLFLHDCPLALTMEQLVGTNSREGLIKRIDLLANSAELNTKQILLPLLRDLKRFAALDGGSGIGMTSTPITTQGGGIGQVVEKELLSSAEDRLLIRVTDEVLDIPKNTSADVVAQLAASFGLITQQELKAKWKSIQNPTSSAFANTLSAPLPLFGHNAPRSIFDKDLKLIPKGSAEFTDWQQEELDCKGFVYLASEQTSLESPFWMWLRFASKPEPQFQRIVETSVVSRSDYGLTQKATRCHLENPEEVWQGVDPKFDPETASIELLRTTLAVIPQRKLELAGTPIQSLIGKGAQASAMDEAYDFKAEVDQIELDGIYLGLKSGQYVIVEGEREEFPGVKTRELKRIKYVQHKLREIPGDSVHTRIYLNSQLQHTYVRSTVTIYANIARATHGETVRQVLGSGDASKPFQELPLAKGPLTYLAAATPTGVESTVAVRVNNLLWHEKETLLDSSANDRAYIVKADDSWRSTIQFGDGKAGARLPTGRENVRAEYRVGLGLAGNVKADSITQLANRPLGLKEVFNPLPATGGADPEDANQIRANAPLAVMALDRLVSVRDYADFARNYSAIDKAVAQRFLVGGQPVVHVTIAGAGDAAIATDSDLYINLKRAYQQLGDPLLSVRVALRELLLMFLSANIRIHPDFEWNLVESNVREMLYQTFSFEQRELGQAMYLSEVQSVIQSVRGVAYVDVEIFSSLAQQEFEAALQSRPGQSTNLTSIFNSLREIKATPNPSIPVEKPRLEGTAVRPAQLLYLNRDVPDSLFLTEIN